MSNGTFIYPNVTVIPGQNGASGTDRVKKKEEGVKGEFDQVFDQAFDQASGKKLGQNPDLNQVKEPLKFSAHASQRLRDRKIQLDSKTLAKVNDAVDRAGAKGIEDALILTSDSALIVNVKNRTVITALDRSSLAGNVFTNIDGAVVI